VRPRNELGGGVAEEGESRKELKIRREMNDEFRIDESKIVVHGSDGPRRPGVLPTKEELLRICFDQEVHGFLQVDAYLMDGVEPAIQSNIVYGLMHDPDNPVTIQIAQGARKDEVLRLLSEVSQALDEDWPRLQEWDGGLRPKFPRDLLD
jgi:hypothetical protein